MGLYRWAFDKTSLSVQESYKIIASEKKNTFIALPYDNEDKIYLLSDTLDYIFN